MSKAINIKLDSDAKFEMELKIEGWYSGKQTYLWFGIGDNCVGTLSGKKLNRLAQRIVKEFAGAELKKLR